MIAGRHALCIFSIWYLIKFSSFIDPDLLSECKFNVPLDCLRCLERSEHVIKKCPTSKLSTWNSWAVSSHSANQESTCIIALRWATRDEVQIHVNDLVEHADTSGFAFETCQPVCLLQRAFLTLTDFSLLVSDIEFIIVLLLRMHTSITIISLKLTCFLSPTQLVVPSFRIVRAN